MLPPFCDPKVLILTIFAQAQSVTLLMVPGQEIDGRFYPRKSIVVPRRAGGTIVAMTWEKA